MRSRRSLKVSHTQTIIRDIVKRESSKEYVCIPELLVYCRRMEVRRSDNELKMGINLMHMIILDNDNKIGMYFAFFNSMYKS